MYPKTYRTLRRHWFHRFLVFLVGIVLLYAPFALLTRLILWASGSPLLPDAHRICMRMPIQWLAQPWMYGTMIQQPAYLVVILVLPADSPLRWTAVLRLDVPGRRHDRIPEPIRSPALSDGPGWQGQPGPHPLWVHGGHDGRFVHRRPTSAVRSAISPIPRT